MRSLESARVAAVHALSKSSMDRSPASRSSDHTESSATSPPTSAVKELEPASASPSFLSRSSVPAT